LVADCAVAKRPVTEIVVTADPTTIAVGEQTTLHITFHVWGWDGVGPPPPANELPDDGERGAGVRTWPSSGVAAEGFDVPTSLHKDLAVTGRAPGTYSIWVTEDWTPYLYLSHVASRPVTIQVVAQQATESANTVLRWDGGVP